MLVLDTDVVSLLQYSESENAQRLIARLVASDQSTAVTITTFEEQVRGRMADCSRAKTPEAYARATEALHRLFRDYQNRVILLFDERAIAEFKRLKQLKVRIGTMDLRIAAIALAHDATLITMNRRDFARVSGLRTADWATD